jgi:hypothetical protein
MGFDGNKNGMGLFLGLFVWNLGMKRVEVCGCVHI